MQSGRCRGIVRSVQRAGPGKATDQIVVGGLHIVDSFCPLPLDDAVVVVADSRRSPLLDLRALLLRFRELIVKQPPEVVVRIGSQQRFHLAADEGAIVPQQADDDGLLLRVGASGNSRDRLRG